MSFVNLKLTMDHHLPLLEDEVYVGNSCGILPDIWECILGYLDCKDLEAVSKTCRVLKDVAERVKSKRMRDILMPQILAILTKDEVLDSIDVKMTDLILPLRGVCKRWRDIGDKIYGDQLVERCSDLTLSGFDLEGRKITNEEDLVQAVLCYGAKHLESNDHRLISRSLSITTGNFSRKYYKIVTRLLGIIGPKIWEFAIVFKGPRRSYSKPEDLLVTWFKLMPNLRYLTVGWYQRNLTLKEKDEAKRTWKQNPFPSLKNLESISFNDEDDRRFPFAGKLLRPNKRVKKLDLDLGQMLLCLKSAKKVQLESLRLIFLDPISFTDLHSVFNFDWKLKCLYIGCEGHFRSDEIFPFLERFKATLEFCMLDVMMTDNKIMLDLPNLKKIRLIMHEDCNNLDFLQVLAKVPEPGKHQTFLQTPRRWFCG